MSPARRGKAAAPPKVAFVPIPRYLFDPEHPLRRGQSVTLWAAALDLWSLAAYTRYERFTARGLVVQERGQVVASRSYLAQRWHLSEKQTRTILRNLVKAGFLGPEQVTPAGTRFDIVGFEDTALGGQDAGTETGTEGASKGPARGRQGAGDKQERTKQDTQNPTEPENTFSRLPNKREKDMGQPGGWPAEATRLWTDAIGEVAPGSIGRALKSAVDRYGWDDGNPKGQHVKRWLQVYLDARPYTLRNGSIWGDNPGDGPHNAPPRDTRFCSPQDFARNLQTWRQRCEPLSGPPQAAAPLAAAVAYLNGSGAK